MDYRIIVLLAFLSLALLPQTLAVQNSETCDINARYCFDNILYDCVSGTPQLIERCRSSCKDAKCVNDVVEPDVSYGGSTEPAPKSNADLTIVVIIVMALGAIIIFFARMKVLDWTHTRNEREKKDIRIRI